MLIIFSARNFCRNTHPNRQDLNDIRSGANNKTRHTHSLTHLSSQSVVCSFAGSSIHSLPFKSPRIRLSFAIFKYNIHLYASKRLCVLAIDFSVPYAGFHRLMTLHFPFMHLLLPLLSRRMSTFLHTHSHFFHLFGVVVFVEPLFRFLRFLLKRNLNQIYVIRYHALKILILLFNVLITFHFRMVFDLISNGFSLCQINTHAKYSVPLCVSAMVAIAAGHFCK